VALWTCRCAWTTQERRPHAHSRSSRKTSPSSRDSRLTTRLRRCQNQTARTPRAPGDIKSEWWARSSRNPGRDQIGTPGRDHRNQHASVATNVNRNAWTHDADWIPSGFRCSSERAFRLIIHAIVRFSTPSVAASGSVNRSGFQSVRNPFLQWTRGRLSRTFHPRLKLHPIPQSKIWDRQEHRN